MTRNRSVCGRGLGREALKIFNERNIDDLVVINAKKEPVGLVDLQEPAEAEDHVRGARPSDNYRDPSPSSVPSADRQSLRDGQGEDPGDEFFQPRSTHGAQPLVAPPPSMEVVMVCVVEIAAQRLAYGK